MTPEWREALLGVQTELERRIRVCPACGGSGLSVLRTRPCQACRTARLALDRAAPLLWPLPTCPGAEESTS